MKLLRMAAYWRVSVFVVIEFFVTGNAADVSLYTRMF